MVLQQRHSKPPYPLDSAAIVANRNLLISRGELQKRLSSNDLALYLVHTIFRFWIVRAWGMVIWRRET